MRSLKKKERDKLIGDFRSGSVAALARLLSLCESESRSRRDLMSSIYPVENQPFVLGITGPAGAGKSSLINRLLFVFRKRFERIAVLAFDPTSKLTGGAFLGDRVRMAEHIKDEGVYIRSMADQGRAGGVGAGIHDTIGLLSAFGFEMVIVETVGTGQSESDVRLIADLVLVVLTPGFGDEIQAMKAGILELGDLFAVNKADQPDAERTETEIKASLALGRSQTAEAPPVFATVATQGRGVVELAGCLLEKYQELGREGVIDARRSKRVEAHVEEMLKEHCAMLVASEIKAFRTKRAKAAGRINPYRLAGALISKIFKAENNAKKD
ncbi:MAG: methylmalonyl Co-A mutase-associated GTPase MeaB [Deltaproteobacteria bacterium]|nr:methylmalonyl Co-A mutase-associated GTPase MeaB [Deltaproteobacteria bacterium]